MRLNRILGNAMLGLGALALIACEPAGSGQAGLTPETSATRSASAQREGDQNHPKIVAKFGGVYQNDRLKAYVNRVGQRIARVSAQPNALWTFTVLDTPTVNAFAIPGGYVYVTRGLVALANDEAQLAGVLGHEIGHIAAGHSALRRQRSTTAGIGLLAGAIGLSVLGVDPNVASGLMNIGQTAAGGYLAQYSRGDELDADNLGVRYLARAGYDPYAQADFLDQLRASSELQARIAGKDYDPNRVDFFASHPSSGKRTRQAIEVAQAAGAVTTAGADRNRAAYLKAIDNMVYGDSAAQGFVDGRTFSHPKLRFTYRVPRRFKITNSADQVVASGPQNSLFIMDGDRNRWGPLTDYIRRVWAPGIAKKYRTGQLSGLRSERINRLESASAVMPVRLNNRTYDALLVAYRLNGKLYRITGLAPQGSGLLREMTEAARSFRRLSATEAGRLREKRIDIVPVRSGDTPERLARRMKFDDYRIERFRLLNGLRPGQPLLAGQKVKLVR